MDMQRSGRHPFSICYQTCARFTTSTD